MPFFSCEAAREVTMAHAMYYAAPTLHPDRVMTEHDLIYLVEGEWEVWEGERAHLLRPGDVLILTAGRRHFGKRGCRAGTRTLFAHVTSDAMDSWRPPEGRQGVALPSLVHCQEAPEVIGCFRQLVDAYWWEDAQRPVRLSALFELLLCALAEAGPEPLGARRRLALAAQRALRLDPQARLDPEALARKLGVSSRSLRYAFEREVGVPLHRYHLNLRLDMALSMLRAEPERTLRDLADAFGFCDEFHFSRAFKRRFGMPPSQAARARTGR